jgi:leucyl aminopeptidase
MNIILLPLYEDFNFDEISKTIPEVYLEGFTGKLKEILIYISPQNEKITALGLGKKRDLKTAKTVFRSFFYNNKSKLKGDIQIRFSEKVNPEISSGVSEGITLAKYELGQLKTNEPQEANWFLGNYNISIDENIDSKGFENGKQIAATQAKIMKWVDTPANFKTPSILAEWIKESGQKYNYETTIFDEKICEELGLKALLAVGRGSIEHPPLMVILKYSHPEATKTVGLIGKGVTFDTGGVSLKPGDNMNYMKSDMGGAAAVIGTFEVAAKLKLKINLIGAVPLTENCIDSFAIKPGDVIGSYLGKTIEVINTDAEGRLILADALAYINKNHKPDIMIDLATLTGNCIQALGYAAAAMMSNNDELANRLILSGENTGEKVWRMPLWDDYKDMMKSDVADIKNLSSAPIAGAITAAKFLEEFIEGHPNWVHLDIAGVAFGDSEFGSMKSATGYGVRLLTDFLEHLAD